MTAVLVDNGGCSTGVAMDDSKLAEKTTAGMERKPAMGCDGSGRHGHGG
jgi:hypothetical protein